MKEVQQTIDITRQCRRITDGKKLTNTVIASQMNKPCHSYKTELCELYLNHIASRD
jgi:hypothetical protein